MKEHIVTATDKYGVTRRERNLDRAVNLAANGRIKPEDIVKTAEEFDTHVEK